MDAAVIVTYRCPMQCKMCNIWKNPTKANEEFRPNILEKLPHLKFANVTGGEPTVRNDLNEIVAILRKKAERVVVSTSGWNEDKLLSLAREFPDIGFRVSIEGLSEKNDAMRGRQGGFDRGLRSLLALRRLGTKDIGVGITISDSNSNDMLALYELAKELHLEFATAALHNSFYFHKSDNIIGNKTDVVRDLKALIKKLLVEPHPKSWFRAYFNMGLLNYVEGGRRLLPCEAGTENFFIDPQGSILPCNGMERCLWYGEMGNLHNPATFEEMWKSEAAQEVRKMVRDCPKNCWMVGTAAPVMKKYLRHIAPWVAKNKLYALIGRPVPSCMPGHLGTC